MGARGFASHDEFVELLNGNPAGFPARLARIFAPNNPVFAGMHTIAWSNEALADKWDAVGRFASDFTTNERRAKIVLYLPPARLAARGLSAMVRQ